MLSSKFAMSVQYPLYPLRSAPIFAAHHKTLDRYGISLSNNAANAYQFPTYPNSSPDGKETYSSTTLDSASDQLSVARLIRSGNISLFQADSIYAINVSVGVPRQSFLLSFDTGTPQTWFLSSSLPKAQQGNHTLYDPRKSKTFEPSTKDYSLRYGDGSSNNGTWGFETIEFGGLAVENTAFGVAKSVSQLYTNGQTAGHFGLTLDSTVLQSLASQKVISNPIFALKLVATGPGEVTFGYVDYTWNRSQITEIPVNEDLHERWRITTDGIRVNGKLIPRRDNAIKEALIDSGTTLAYLQPSVVKEIYTQISGARFDEVQQAYLVPQGSRYPTVTFVLGGQEYPVPTHLTSPKYDVGDGSSLGEYQSTNEDDVFEYYGAVFLTSVVAVHDFKRRQIGFARRF